MVDNNCQDVFLQVRSFADCFCDISRVELLLYVVEIVFTCNKEVIEDLMVSIS